VGLVQDRGRPRCAGWGWATGGYRLARAARGKGKGRPRVGPTPITRVPGGEASREPWRGARRIVGWPPNAVFLDSRQTPGACSVRSGGGRLADVVWPGPPGVEAKAAWFGAYLGECQGRQAARAASAISGERRAVWWPPTNAPGPGAGAGLAVGERRIPSGKGCPGTRQRPPGGWSGIHRVGCRGARPLGLAQSGPRGARWRRAPSHGRPWPGSGVGAARVVRGGGGQPADAVCSELPGVEAKSGDSARDAGGRGRWGGRPRRDMQGARVPLGGCSRAPLRLRRKTGAARAVRGGGWRRADAVCSGLPGVEAKSGDSARDAGGRGRWGGPPQARCAERASAVGRLLRNAPLAPKQVRGGTGCAGWRLATGGCRLLGADCRAPSAACLDGRGQAPGPGGPERVKGAAVRWVGPAPEPAPGPDP
jgi:hypothetical protein